MKNLRLYFVAVLILVIQSECSNPSSPTKVGVIVVYVFSGISGAGPVGGIRAQLIQTGEMKTTDSTGVVPFQVKPGSWTIRVYDLQGGGPVLHTVDSTVQIKGGEIDTLKYFDCLMCR